MCEIPPVERLEFGDSYEIPLMDECIDSLSSENIFTTVDANSGHLKIPMRQEDGANTSFVNHAG